ncbi:MAG: hypothetical protein ABSE89_09015 [Sedimentisphaerales bacterium]
MKSKLTLLMCAAAVISVSTAAFALNSGHQFRHRWFGQDANQPAGQEPNQPGHRQGLQKMMAKREARLEKMIDELNQIRQTAQSENATKTVAALDKMIEKLQAAEDKMKNFTSDANQPPRGHRFHRGGGKGQQSDPNQA